VAFIIGGGGSTAIKCFARIARVGQRAEVVTAQIATGFLLLALCAVFGTGLMASSTTTNAGRLFEITAPDIGRVAKPAVFLVKIASPAGADVLVTLDTDFNTDYNLDRVTPKPQSITHINGETRLIFTTLARDDLLISISAKPTRIGRITSAIRADVGRQRNAMITIGQFVVF
jgi:hypothetical protein